MVDTKVLASPPFLYVTSDGRIKLMKVVEEIGRVRMEPTVGGDVLVTVAYKTTVTVIDP